ncbi:MAG: DMT family transporter [Rhodobacteraceae bacterium]|nr:DMT family transporter [Paracoccaceae bacterium]
MERKDHIDLLGGTALLLLSLMLGLNQVMIKVVNDGMQPVFSAGMRSVLAFVLVLAYALWRKKRLTIRDGSLVAGIVTGILFALEFISLFLALDYTTVTRVSIFFYSMPIWMTLGAHFWIKGERITTRKAIGLALAMAGVVWAFSDRGTGGGSLLGDVMCTIAAMCWAGIGLIARVTKMNRSTPEMQLLYQLSVSALILMPLAFLLQGQIGPVIRDLQMWHLAVFAVMVVGVVAIGFLVWFWILSIYPSSEMASYAFLSPVFGVIFGWLLLDEVISLTIIGALVLVSAGIVLINRKPKARAG